MKFIGVLAALACATLSLALPQHGGASSGDNGLGAEICEQVKNLHLGANGGANCDVTAQQVIKKTHFIAAALYHSADQKDAQGDGSGAATDRENAWKYQHIYDRLVGLYGDQSGGW